jgi:parvulin-like peptidyl-prolyl isomerase
MTRDRSACSAISETSLTKRIQRHWLRFFLASLSLIALCVVIRCYWDAPLVNAEEAEEAPIPPGASAPSEPVTSPATAAQRSEAAPSTPVAEPAKDASMIVATVNTQRITRKELALECRKAFGAEVLESMVNKHLIVAECHRQNVTVTGDEVDAEITRMAKRFNIPVDQWMKMLKQERNIAPEQYRNDIIWPTLALRKLAGERLKISRDELVREFDIQYGEAVRARLIAVSSLAKAKELQAKAAADPSNFGNLAKNYSEDAPSASAKGVINPIRKHGSYKEIEQAVFNMADGGISPVIHAGGQYVILKREGLLPAKDVKLEQVSPKLEEIIRDRKMRSVAQDVFQQLQQEAKVENVWNDAAKREKMPGVAALINNEPLTIRELDEDCVARHGREVLEGLINRRLLEQACKRKSLAITEEDLQAEIAQAALIGGKIKADGTPDVEAWLELVTKKQNIPLETYKQDVVWPSAALRKLVGNKIKVTDEDLRKGYEANYGTQVRCLAIVLNNARRAQQVFEMARKNNTSEAFGELATQYSVEASSQANAGEVPPIRKFGGQPQLEDEAFQLKPGEISGVIQVGEKFVILRCEGLEKKANVPFERVRNDIRDDLFEKKLRLAMSECFENLQEAAAIDNYLNGTSHSPHQERAANESQAPRHPSLRQVPGK